MKILRSLLELIAIITLLGLPQNAFANKHHRYNDVSIEIISHWRGRLDLIRAPSDRGKLKNHYLIARHNEPYHIRVSNNGNRRVAVVIAVDGINILTGRPSDLKSSERLIVLEPSQMQEFEGVQKGRHHIDGFFFNTKERYYGDTWGGPVRLGVIALAVFDEKHRRSNKHRYGHWKRNGRSGKGYGANEYFVPRKRATAKKFITYDSRSSLCRIGIAQCKSGNRRNHNRHMRHGNNGYVSIPSWHFELRF